MTPPVTPPSTGESLPRIPLAGAEPRDGAFGAEYVSGWLRLVGPPRLGQPAATREMGEHRRDRVVAGDR